MYKFAQPEAFYLLLALVPLGLLFGWFMWGRAQAEKKFGEKSLILRLMPQRPRHKHQVKFALVCLAIVSLVVALARPQWSTKTEPVTRSGVDLMIALDVSNSMLAEDEKPSRLAKARQFISSLIDELKGDRVGLIIFAGNAYLQVPLTSDYIATKSLLKTVGPRLAPTQGTAIADAIKLADEAFESGEKQFKALVVISDGENHEADAVVAAKEAAEKGVLIHTIGVGSPRGGPIPEYVGGRQADYKRDREGNIVFSKLNEQMLRDVAAQADGDYFRLSASSDNVGAIIGALASMEKKDFEEVVFTDYEEQYQWFLALGLFFLILEYFVSERRNTFFVNWAIFRNENQN